MTWLFLPQNWLILDSKCFPLVGLWWWSWGNHMQDCELAHTVMCLKVVLYSVITEMCVTRADASFIIRTWISLKACRDRLGLSRNEEVELYILQECWERHWSYFLSKTFFTVDFVSAEMNPEAKSYTIKFYQNEKINAFVIKSHKHGN